MKELEQQHQEPQEIRAEIAKQSKYVQSQMKFPGQTIWEYNKQTKKLDKAQIKHTTLEKTKTKVSRTGEPQPDYLRHKVMHSDNLFFVQALNRKNAIRKLKNFGFEVVEEDGKS